MEISLKEVEVSKINLQPGDVLMVTVKHNDVDYNSLNALQKKMETLFPNNQVFAMNVGEDGDTKFAVVRGAAPQPAQNYCTDCDCGKKERVEAAKNGAI